MAGKLTVVAIGVAAAVLAVVLAVLVPSRGQASGAYAPARTADGKPDLNGIWQAMNTANWDLQDHAARQGPVIALGAAFSVPAGSGVVEGNEIPYQPWAAGEEEGERRELADRRSRNQVLPAGRAARDLHAVSVSDRADPPNNILMAYEFASASRIVRMSDSREKRPTDSWMGWSRGRWEGDTLVVDVTALNDQTWFDRAGNFHSDALHVVERYTPTGPDVLRYEATIEDPKVFTRPWKISMPLYRRTREERAQLFEYKCVEFVEPIMYGHLSKKPAQEGAAR